MSIKRLCCIALLAFGLAAALGLPLPQRASAATASRACGSVRARGLTFHVTIGKGIVTCTEARHVLYLFMTGHGVRNGGPASYQTYWTLGAWRCGTGAGGGACIRHGTNYTTARDYILASS
jgi:hypothetical protein